jgi:hypothetical protein
MDINKEVAKAQKRLATFINKRAEQAQKETAEAFAEARQKLNIKEGK